MFEFSSFCLLNTTFGVRCHNGNAICRVLSIQVVKKTMITDEDFLVRTLYIAFMREMHTLFCGFSRIFRVIIASDTVGQDSSLLRR